MVAFSVPTITVKKEDSVFGLPRELIWKDKQWVKHVSCNGSRFHVYRYGIALDKKAVITCNETNCIVNAPDSVQIEASKLCGILNNLESQ